MLVRRRSAAKDHVLIDTQGLLLNVDVHATEIQDRDGAERLQRQVRRRFPFVESLAADGGYAGAKLRALVTGTGPWDLRIIKRTDLSRFAGWSSARSVKSVDRRLCRDYELRTRIAFARLAIIASCSGDVPQPTRYGSEVSGRALR